MKKYIALLLIFAFVLSFCSCTEVVDLTSFDTSDSKDISLNSSEIYSEHTEESENESSEISEQSIPEEPKDDIVTFLACPDNLIHPCIYFDAIKRDAENNNTTPVYTDLHNASYDFDYIYTEVAERISSADISYINQESLIGGDYRRVHGYPCFNTPNAMGETLVNVGFDVVNVAHNHMLDSDGTEFLEHCNEFFTTRNVDVIGYYPNEESLENIKVIEKNNIKIAFLSYTYGTNGFEVPSDSEVIVPFFDEELVKKQVSIAKEVADFIIVSSHWGYENTYSVNKTQRNYANLMTELGVDVVLGMHPHNIQPIEWKTASNGSKTLVVYSLGNYLSGMQRGMNLLGGMLELKIVRDCKTQDIYIDSPLFIPTVTHCEQGDEFITNDDRGYRNYKIYYLNDYTEELVNKHAAHGYEKNNDSTLVGGKFSLETLYATVNEYIDKEILE